MPNCVPPDVVCWGESVTAIAHAHRGATRVVWHWNACAQALQGMKAAYLLLPAPSLSPFPTQATILTANVKCRRRSGTLQASPRRAVRSPRVL